MNKTDIPNSRIIVAVLTVEGKVVNVFSKLETAVKSYQDFQKISDFVVLDTHEVIET